ncbi:MAG TPA: hypothetical protein VJI12_04260 [archaeon]|nr:hypothetical protein [archaeon]
MLSPSEKKILKKIGESQLISRPDLKKFLQSNGSSADSIDIITKGLVKKSLVSEINPVGSTCYVITQRGNKMLEELKI